MMDVNTLRLSDYTYFLDESLIAQEPLTPRDSSRLLVYNKGSIHHKIFRSLSSVLKEGVHLCFNDTKVLPARLFFEKSTGARIEIFLLSPILPSKEVVISMQALGKCQWKCQIGNLKRWKNEPLQSKIKIEDREFTLDVHLINREERIVEFSWKPSDLRFSEVLQAIGNTPLPPYIRREVSAEDDQRYQTVYAKYEGAVAAPTAGLHFTDEILQELQKNQSLVTHLTLHVGAGTFQPLKDEVVIEHKMHEEFIHVRKDSIKNLTNTQPIIAVGTTSMRTLESLYHLAHMRRDQGEWPLIIPKLQPYTVYNTPMSREEAMKYLLQKLEEEDMEALQAYTEIMIVPGYEFKMADGIITNFHMPDSTLILLIAAFIGADWRTIYEEAVQMNYRFLSYGDSSLLIPKNSRIALSLE